MFLQKGKTLIKYHANFTLTSRCNDTSITPVSHLLVIIQQIHQFDNTSRSCPPRSRPISATRRSQMKIITGRYQSFLLRMWRESPEGEWRATLQEVKTGNCHHFANLEDLMKFLTLRTGQPNLALLATEDEPLTHEKKADEDPVR